MHSLNGSIDASLAPNEREALISSGTTNRQPMINTSLFKKSLRNARDRATSLSEVLRLINDRKHHCS